MARDVEYFSNGDIVRFKSPEKFPDNWDIPDDFFDIEYIVQDVEEYNLIYLSDDGISIGGYFARRLEHVHQPKLSVESLQEYEGLFE
jgi:hypothetical protein